MSSPTSPPPPLTQQQEDGEGAATTTASPETAVVTKMNTPLTRVDGIGLWKSWTRNFRTPLLALFDLLDNAMDATLVAKENREFAGKIYILPDSFEREVEVEEEEEEDDDDDDEDEEDEGDKEEDLQTQQSIKTEELEDMNVDGNPQDKGEPQDKVEEEEKEKEEKKKKKKEKTSKPKETKKKTVSVTTGIRILNNSVRPIKSLEEILQVYRSNKLASESIGENGVGLKQGCATIADLNFVLRKSGGSLSFGVLAASLQTSEGCTLPSFELKTRLSSEDEGQVLEGVRQEMRNLLDDDSTSIRDCVVAYGEGSFDEGLERLCQHFAILMGYDDDVEDGGVTSWGEDEHVFCVVLHRLRHNVVRSIRGTVSRSSGVFANKDVAAAAAAAAAAVVADPAASSSLRLLARQRKGAKGQVGDEVAERLLAQSKVHDEDEDDDDIHGSIPMTNEDDGADGNGVISVEECGIRAFGILDDLAAKLPRQYIHVPPTFDVRVGKTALKFNYWQRRLIDLTQFQVPIDPLHSIKTATDWKDPLTKEAYMLRVFVGFNPYFRDRNASPPACLYIYSRESGRLIKRESDARPLIGLGTGGTAFAQGLTLIVDDVHGKLPLSPTKQDVAFGEQSRGETHKRNLYTWLNALVHMFWTFHLEKCAFKSKAVLRQKVLDFADRDEDLQFEEENINEDDLPLSASGKKLFYKTMGNCQFTTFHNLSWWRPRNGAIRAQRAKKNHYYQEVRGRDTRRFIERDVGWEQDEENEEERAAVAKRKRKKAAAARRGRPKKFADDEVEVVDDDDDDEDDEDGPVAKRARKSSGGKVGRPRGRAKGGGVGDDLLSLDGDEGMTNGDDGNFLSEALRGDSLATQEEEDELEELLTGSPNQSMKQRRHSSRLHHHAYHPAQSGRRGVRADVVGSSVHSGHAPSSSGMEDRDEDSNERLRHVAMDWKRRYHDAEDRYRDKVQEVDVLTQKVKDLKRKLSDTAESKALNAALVVGVGDDDDDSDENAAAKHSLSAVVSGSVADAIQKAKADGGGGDPKENGTTSQEVAVWKDKCRQVEKDLHQSEFERQELMERIAQLQQGMGKNDDEDDVMIVEQRAQESSKQVEDLKRELAKEQKMKRLIERELEHYKEKDKQTTALLAIREEKLQLLEGQLDD